jgi:hypothetical protein
LPFQQKKQPDSEKRFSSVAFGFLNAFFLSEKEKRQPLTETNLIPVASIRI